MPPGNARLVVILTTTRVIILIFLAELQSNLSLIILFNLKIFLLVYQGISLTILFRISAALDALPDTRHLSLEASTIPRDYCHFSAVMVNQRSRCCRILIIVPLLYK